MPYVIWHTRSLGLSSGWERPAVRQRPPRYIQATLAYTSQGVVGPGMMAYCLDADWTSGDNVRAIEDIHCEMWLRILM